MPITRTNNNQNSAESNSGRFTQGGTVDRFSRRLGWWERVTWERSFDDITVVIDKRTEGRPDLVAWDVYQKANLQWFVLQYNNIVDINTELTVGARLVLPTPTRMQTTVLTRATGGNQVT